MMLAAIARNPIIVFLLYLSIRILLHLLCFSFLCEVLAARASLPIDPGLLILSVRVIVLALALVITVPSSWILPMPGKHRCDSQKKNTASEPRELRII
jgi:hypothetical protein